MVMRSLDVLPFVSTSAELGEEGALVVVSYVEEPSAGIGKWTKLEEQCTGAPPGWLPSVLKTPKPK